MTATDGPDAGIDDKSLIYLWLAKPQVGREQLLMVLTDHPEHGTTYRPLMFLDAAHALECRDVAAEAAAAMGVQAVLREFVATSTLDATEHPQAGS